MRKILKRQPEIILLCQNVRSLHNVGSIFRTADAYGVAKIYLCGYTGAPPRDQISKVALGAEQWIPWENKKSTWQAVESLRLSGYEIVALEQEKSSISITKFKPKYPLVLIVGNEVGGVTKEIIRRADKIVHLPMFGQKESLNVAVACGIALASLRYCIKK